MHWRDFSCAFPRATRAAPIGASMSLFCAAPTWAISSHAATPSRRKFFIAVVPTAEAKAKAEALIQELFKDDIAKAKSDPVARARLALTFLQEGKDTADDPAGRYVLYQHALSLAAQAGDAPTALQAIEEIALD